MSYIDLNLLFAQHIGRAMKEYRTILQNALKHNTNDLIGRQFEDGPSFNYCVY